MTAKAYHKDIGFPEGLDVTPPKGLWLYYTNHAKREAMAEGIKFGDLPTRLPSFLDVIEVEVQGGCIQKWVVRDSEHCLPGARDYDLVLVILLDGTVKTLWLNHQGDTHKTLQRNRYTVPSTVVALTPNR